jgi:hypothetical protein
MLRTTKTTGFRRVKLGLFLATAICAVSASGAIAQGKPDQGAMQDIQDRTNQTNADLNKLNPRGGKPAPAPAPAPPAPAPAPAPGVIDEFFEFIDRCWDRCFGTGPSAQEQLDRAVEQRRAEQQQQQQPQKPAPQKSGGTQTLPNAGSGDTKPLNMTVPQDRKTSSVLRTDNSDAKLATAVALPARNTLALSAKTSLKTNAAAIKLDTKAVPAVLTRTSLATAKVEPVAIKTDVKAANAIKLDVKTAALTSRTSMPTTIATAMAVSVAPVVKPVAVAVPTKVNVAVPAVKPAAIAVAAPRLNVAVPAVKPVTVAVPKVSVPTVRPQAVAIPTIAPRAAVAIRVATPAVAVRIPSVSLR